MRFECLDIDEINEGECRVRRGALVTSFGNMEYLHLKHKWKKFHERNWATNIGRKTEGDTEVTGGKNFKDKQQC